MASQLPSDLPAKESEMQMTSRIVLAAFGSLGDIVPFVSVALGLKQRGHRVVVATHKAYGEHIAKLGIEFRTLRPDLPQANGNARRRRGSRWWEYEVISRYWLLPQIAESYQDLREAVHGADLLVAHTAVLAAPLVARTVPMAWVSAVPAPATFEFPMEPAFVKMLRSLGGPRRLLDKLARRSTKSWLHRYRALEARLGLSPGGNPLFEGQFSEHLVLALYSEILSPASSHLPVETRITGFPFLPDEELQPDASEKLRQFLIDGPAPIVFTLGSSASPRRNFLRESIEAAKKLGRRALIVGWIHDRESEIAEYQTPDVAVFGFVPFGMVFPHAAAIVHHGGIGTTGLALRAGRPSLAVPICYDQPTNARCAERLGVSRAIPLTQYDARRATSELAKLVEDPSYSANASRLGQQLREEDGTKNACDAIESYLTACASQARTSVLPRVAREIGTLVHD